jgi:hypothetical protein
VMTIIIPGSGDDAQSKLKASLDAQNSSFDASLAALFKSAPPAQTPAAPARTQTAPAAGLHASGGWSLATKRKDEGTSRSRLRI